ncbi:MAG: DedA family protein [Cytophagaceae bacterium]|nr:DedA family protein [Cytophagaceae bacterium]MDW8455753.1 DedA family protein [Cytophagaceae bacterium]
MENIKKILDFFLHLDHHLSALFIQYGTWIYAILFLIIFVETGLVVMPLLPGDSLLFAVGVMARKESLDLATCLILLTIAAIAGDSLNYAIGKYLGNKVFYSNSRWIKKEYLLRTQEFYEKHGGKTIIIARFIPIIRTFAPFVAGVGKMNYKKFISFNIIGGIVWVCGITMLGYAFAHIEFVEKNFETVIFAIIFISLLPAIIEYIKHARTKK